MLNTPFSPWPSFTEEEADTIRRVLLSNKVNSWTGTECKEFEREFAAWVGTEFAISLTNGTLALDLALHGLSIGARNGGLATDEVIVTPRSFIASASCVANAGAVPVFADVDRNSGNLSAATIAHAISPRTRAVIPVHLAGWPCDMDPIMAQAREHRFRVIEDCAQAHGALYKGRSVGSIGDVGAWSFCQDKIMTTGGEGGMVTCSDRNIWSRMWSFKDHGKSWNAVHERQHPPGFRWLHEGFGTNWRMLEIQAALGRVQLKRMNQWTAAREANAAALDSALESFAGPRGPVRVPDFRSECCKGSNAQTGCRHARYKYYAYVQPENLSRGWTRDRIVAEIVQRGVPAYQGSCSEIYLERAFDDTGWRPESPLPVAHELGETSLMFLVHPTLSAVEIETMGRVISSVMALASRGSENRAAQ